MSGTVTEKAKRVQTVEDQNKLDAQLDLGQKNYASDEKARASAKGIVAGCIADAEPLHNMRRGVWEKMEKAYGLESLSANAWDYGVHLGSVFSAVEEFATKMNSTIFSGREIIGGSPEDRDSGKKAEASVALVREELKNDVKLADRGVEMFREVGIKGAVVWKLVPSKRIIRTYERSVDSRDTDEGVQYKFGKTKRVEIADTKYEAQPVLAEDFRIPSTASSIEEAHWCGHFFYMTGQEIADMVKREVFDASSWEALKDKGAEETGKKQQNQRKTHDRLPNRRAAPDAGPHLDQYGLFEWWGEMSLTDGGEVVPCVVTLAMRASSDGGQYDTAVAEVLRITENPYFHQRKPYVAYRPLARQGEFWTRGPAEIVANNSYFEDEMAMFALMAAALESSPPLEVGEDAGVLDDELDGFLPGHRFRVEQTGLIGFVAPPARSGIGFQTAEYLSSLAKENAGLGKPANAPRAAAAGIMTDAQQLDLRQAAWVYLFESQFLKPLCELLHSYNRQYMTRERKLNVLGVDGLNAEDIRTVRPTDLAVEVRFEPIVGRQLMQQATQIQGYVNMLDRMMMINQMEAQSGKPPLFDLQYVVWMVLQDGFQVRDNKVLTRFVDPMDLRTPAEEHLMWQRGDQVDTQKGENVAQHLSAHISFVQSPAFGTMEPESQQLAIDHIYETLDNAARETSAAMPGITDMLNEMLGKEAGHSRPGFGAQASGGGGAGVASPSQAPGSPAVRRPSPGMMGAPNGGAM
jgi:hypothetical protein